MKQEHIQWCRQLFDSLNDGGMWSLPECGLVFRKIGTELVLVEIMPHFEAMGITAEKLRQFQESEYEINRQHFEAAGIKMRRLQ